jgi:hypothetical protein
MSLFMYSLGAAMVFMIIGISLAVTKDVRQLSDFPYDPNNPTNRSMRG